MEQNVIFSGALELQPFTAVQRRECKLLEKKEGSGGRRVGWRFAFMHEAGTRAERSEAALKDRDRATAVCGCLKSGSKSDEEGRCSVVVK